MGRADEPTCHAGGRGFTSRVAPVYEGRVNSLVLAPSLATADDHDIVGRADETSRGAWEHKPEMERPVTRKREAHTGASVEASLCEWEPRESLA